MNKVVIKKIRSKKIIENKSPRIEVKKIKEKRDETGLEGEIFEADESANLAQLWETLRKQKAPVLERITTVQRKNLEENVPAVTQAKKEDDVKYGAKVEYGTNRENATDRRDVRYQTTTEYTTGMEEKRKFQEAEAFNPNLIQDRDQKEGERRPAMRNMRSEYETKKRKYQ